MDDRRDGEPADKPKPKAKAKAKAKPKARAQSEPPKRTVRFNVADADDRSVGKKDEKPASASEAPTATPVSTRAAQILERNERLITSNIVATVGSSR